MTFSIDNPEGVDTTPFGKYVWEKPSGEQGLRILLDRYVAEISQGVVILVHQNIF